MGAFISSESAPFHFPEDKEPNKNLIPQN